MTRQLDARVLHLIPQSTANADIVRREFLSLVEFETKKKRAAVKEAGHYLDKLMKKITHDEQDLKDKLEALAATAYVLPRSP